MCKLCDDARETEALIDEAVRRDLVKVYEVKIGAPARQVADGERIRALFSAPATP